MPIISKDRVQQFKSVAHKYFDWKTVLEESGAGPIQDLQDQLLLPCPLHPDKRPSFRVRLRHNDCHCFSCGYWGTVADIMYEMSGKSVPRYQYFEQILKRTPGMQSELGFKSLYVDAKTLDPAFEKRPRFSAVNHIGSKMPLDAFSRMVRQLGESWENLVYSLTLMQAGEELENILAQMKKSNENKEAAVQEVSLLSLLEE